MPDKPIVQRNQNQSAVGGCDLTGTYGLAIEVKRQETLSINTWWAQCLKSAKELGEHPVLLFRQNAKPGQRTKWRCITFVEVRLPAAHLPPLQVRAEMEYDDFKKWFRDWTLVHIKAENPHAGHTVVVPLPPSASPEVQVALTRARGLFP